VIGLQFLKMPNRCKLQQTEMSCKCKFFFVLLQDAVVISLIFAVMFCEHKRAIESDNEFLALRAMLCSVTSATISCFRTFCRAILSELRVRNFQFRCVFRSVIHCSLIKKTNIFDTVTWSRKALINLIIPARPSVFRHISEQFPLDWFSCNLILWASTKIYRNPLSFL
jgi:hypothetical protein